MNIVCFVLFAGFVFGKCEKRRDWNSLSHSEKIRFTDRIIELKKSGQYDQFTKLHLAHQDKTHGKVLFCNCSIYFSFGIVLF